MVEIRLPDFSEMSEVIEEIGQLALEKAKLDIKIKTIEADVYLKVTTDGRYFQNGKAPSVSFVEKTWAYTGLTQELLPLRESYARTSALLDHFKLKYDSMKMAIDIWRTQSANERSATL